MKANTGLKEAHRAYKIFFNKSLYSSSSYFSLCRWSATSAMWLQEIVRYKRSCIVWLSSIIAAFSSSVFLSLVKDYVCTSWFDVTRHIGTFNSNVTVLSLFCGGFDLISFQPMSWWTARTALLMVGPAAKSWSRRSTSNWELLLPLGSIRSE